MNQAGAVKVVYGTYGLSRSHKKVTKEITMAMQQWNHDGQWALGLQSLGGILEGQNLARLDMIEFIGMICGSDQFKIKISDGVSDDILSIG